MSVLISTNFTNYGIKRTGKVRDIYEQEDKLLLVATDRHSSFDRIIAHIPQKGEVLNLLSAFWFEKTKDIVNNHVVAIPDPAVTVAKKVRPLPIESVMRGYLTGSTATSIWTLYKAGQRNFGNFVLPDAMYKNQKLASPVFTPTTKEDEHDRTITPQEIVESGQIARDQLDKIETISRKLFARGQELAEAAGLILVDTKYEFGLDENHELVLIDELHTPDSSRYWKLDSYDERVGMGHEPEYFDKEFLRLWFKENSDPYQDEVLPEAPADMVEELSRRYQEIYTQITGEIMLEAVADPEKRISENLAPYVYA